MKTRGAAPLSFDSISKLISDKENQYIIDYNQSKIKGNKLLVYLTNLDLNVDIDFNGDKEAAFEIMHYYFKSEVACEISALDNLAMAIILEYKSLNSELLLNDLQFEREDIKDFLKIEDEGVFRASVFLDSLPLFMQTTIPQLNDLLKLENSLDIIDDKKYVTNNISTMIKTPGFIDYYLSGQYSMRSFYFKKQFEDYMFKGKNLYAYLFESKSLVYGMLVGLLSEEIEIESLQLAREVADGFEAG